MFVTFLLNEYKNKKYIKNANTQKLTNAMEYVNNHIDNNDTMVPQEESL